MGHITLGPLGPPSLSFLPLIGLGDVGILLVGCHLAVAIILLSQRGIGLRDFNAQSKETCHHLLVLSPVTAGLTPVGC